MATEHLCLTIIAIFLLSDVAQSMLVALKPFKLQLYRLVRSANSTFVVDDNRKARTVPEFFMDSMGLYPGDDATFDLDRWQEIQNCGLFRNITIKACQDSDGCVFFQVLGEERPSISISPEVSLQQKETDSFSPSGGVNQI